MIFNLIAFSEDQVKALANIGLKPYDKKTDINGKECWRYLCNGNDSLKLVHEHLPQGVEVKLGLDISF